MLQAERLHGDGNEVRYNTIVQLRATNSWGDLYATLEPLMENWADQRRFDDAGLLLGFLEANDIHHSLTSQAQREAAAAAVRADPHGALAIERGRAIDRDDLFDFVLDRLGSQHDPPHTEDKPA